MREQNPAYGLLQPILLNMLLKGRKEARTDLFLQPMFL